MRITATLALLSALFVSACSAEQPPADREQQERVARGEALFADLCAKCHPRSGRGDYLLRIPETLLVRRSETELMAWIAGSDKHRLMPNFVDLTEDEKRDLASYLLSQLPKK